MIESTLALYKSECALVTNLKFCDFTLELERSVVQVDGVPVLGIHHYYIALCCSNHEVVQVPTSHRIEIFSVMNSDLHTKPIIHLHLRIRKNVYFAVGQAHNRLWVRPNVDSDV